MSIALKYGIFNLAYFGNAIILTRGNQNIIARNINLFEFIRQGNAVFHQNHGRAVQNILYRGKIFFHKAKNNIHYHQGGNRNHRAGDGKILPQKRLLRGFTNYQKKNGS